MTGETPSFGRLTTYSENFTSWDYLPDHKRQPLFYPTMPIIAAMIDKAVATTEIPADQLLDPLIREIMADYQDVEAVQAYFNSYIKSNLGITEVILYLFDLIGVDLTITEWFNSDFPIRPFKFFVNVIEPPTLPLSKIIDLIYKVKNERSHLASIRDEANCPGYFILNRHKMSSNAYLTEAIGSYYQGIKVCYTIKEPILIADPRPASVSIGYSQTNTYPNKAVQYSATPGYSIGTLTYGLYKPGQITSRTINNVGKVSSSEPINLTWGTSKIVWGTQDVIVSPRPISYNLVYGTGNLIFEDGNLVYTL